MCTFKLMLTKKKRMDYMKKEKAKREFKSPAAVFVDVRVLVLYILFTTECFYM